MINRDEYSRVVLNKRQSIAIALSIIDGIEDYIQANYAEFLDFQKSEELNERGDKTNP